jgi:hypothetical protein
MFMEAAKGERKILWYENPFLGAFAKVRRATINFAISVCLPDRPSVRPPALNNSAKHWTNFHEI